MLNQYQTNLYILNHNLTTIKVNLVGEGSYQLNKILKYFSISLYYIYDKYLNYIKKIGGNPIMNLNEIKHISTIKEISSKDYTFKDALNILLNDLKIINNMNNQVGEYSLKNNDFKSINLVLEFNNSLEDIIYKLNKLN